MNFQQIKARIQLALALTLYALITPQRNFRSNTQARGMMLKIIGLVLGVTVAGYTLPDAISALTNSTQYAATVPAPVVTLMTLVAGIVVAVVFLIMLLKHGESD